MNRQPHVKPQKSPAPTEVLFDGVRYPLLFEKSGWRLRSKSKASPANFRTGLLNLKDAQEKAIEWLKENAGVLNKTKGGTMEAVAALYLATPKRTKANVAKDNVSRLRNIVRAVAGKELYEARPNEIDPDFWQAYQRKALEAKGRTFDLVTRYRENVAVNSAVRAARCLFLPPLLRVYRDAGLGVRKDAGEAVMLPEPYIPPTTVDDDDLLKQWAELETADPRLWLVIGLARFAGLRREEIAACRVGWLEEKKGVLTIWLRDRPEEQWWTKTGKPYRAQIIHVGISAHLRTLAAQPQDTLIISDPGEEDRGRWFERKPQQWLHAHGVKAAKPLHRMRGLYADHIANITADAVTARLAGEKAAQESLGHTTAETTKNHYLSNE